VSSEIEIKEQLTCDECGRFGAMEFDGKKLCADCYGTACSCCPEFGRENEAETNENQS
jgi:hypothetical protein